MSEKDKFAKTNTYVDPFIKPKIHGYVEQQA
jgi:hypothetical protein